MRRDLRTCSSTSSQRGFSMLEILVTMVIVATALFGTAGLQVYAMRVNQSGQLRTQAVFLASDIAERMEANKTVAAAGNYALALTSTKGSAITICSANACNEAELAAWDLVEWGNAVFDLLPQASWQITFAPPAIPGDPSNYSIVINWTDRRNNTQYATAGTGETFSYTASRSIVR
ncbi:MAG: type IV pilus modification protein PilV [Nitrosomonadales bacterium]|nr:type IV pilus modification protein PilV [Nitrosomonadales bacterium]